MDGVEYTNLVAFIESQQKNKQCKEYPVEMLGNSDLKANFRRKAHKFEVRDGVLYRKVKVKKRACPDRMQLVRVARAHELPTLLAAMHGEDQALHKGRDAMMQRIRGEWWWKGKKQDVSDWVRSCDWCQRNRPSSFEPPLRPIVASAPQERLPSSLRSDAFIHPSSP